MRQRVSLERWIHDALTDPDKEEKCSMISLVHVVGQNNQKEIHTTKFGSGKVWAEKDLAEMFRGKAQTYCQDLPGVQTFQLMAFYGGSTQPTAFMPFTEGGKTDYDGLMTEPPTPEGRLQMNKRNEQALISQVYRRQAQMDDYAIRIQETMCKGMQQAIHAMQECTRENREAFGIVKDMLMEKALDNHKHNMAQLEYERSTAERRKWMQWAPALLNTVLGRNIFPQETADTSLVESIADALSDDDVMKLAGAIPPHLMGPLAARMEAYYKKKNAEKEELKALALSAAKVRDPEADAAGELMLGNGKAS